MYKWLMPCLLVLCMASCAKNKKSCWRCYFQEEKDTNKVVIRPELDTTVCDMTTEENTAFQQQVIEERNARYGPGDKNIVHACHKVTR